MLVQVAAKNVGDVSWDTI